MNIAYLYPGGFTVTAYLFKRAAGIKCVIGLEACILSVIYDKKI